MTEYLSKTHTPGQDGALTGLPGQQGLLYAWMRVLAGGGTSEFSEVRMRGPIYDKNGVEILGGGGGGGSLSTLSDVQLGIAPFPPLGLGQVLAYVPAISKWGNAPLPPIPDALDDLNDVTLGAPGNPVINRQRLIWDNIAGAWINNPSWRAFAGIDGRSDVVTPGSTVTFGVPLTTYDSFGTFGITPSGIITVNDQSNYQYDIILELDGTANDNASVRLQLNGVPYGPTFTQSVKTGDSIQFMLSGTFTQTNATTVTVLYTSSGAHNITAMAGSWTLTDI